MSNVESNLMINSKKKNSKDETESAEICDDWEQIDQNVLIYFYYCQLIISKTIKIFKFILITNYKAIGEKFEIEKK
jgi:hypothetical protein